MKKILFLSPTLNIGGGEKVLTTIMNNLSREKYKVTVALIKGEGELLKQLKPDINVIDLKAERVIYSPLKLLKLIKKEDPDIIFSGAGHLSCILGVLKPLIKKNIKLIGRQRGTIKGRTKRNPQLKIKVLNVFYKTFLKNMDCIILQSEFMKKNFLELLNFSEKKLKVINNPVDFDDIEKKISSSNESLFQDKKVNILTVGRLTKVKQQAKMIDLIKILDHKKYHLNLVGEGELKKNLQTYAEEIGVENQITFWGFQNNPYKFMKEADLFILTSKVEAFPNVILEAGACGLYTLAFQCEGGIKEVIKPKVNGELIQNEDLNKMAEKIQNLILNKEDQINTKNFVRKFSVYNSLEDLEKIL